MHSILADSRRSGARVIAFLLMILITSTAGSVAAADASRLATAVEVTFQVTVPPETPEGDSVYIAGDFQGWDPGDPAYRLTEIGPLLHEIVISFTPGTTIQFKFTRGDWSRVEKGPNGEEIPNRTLFIDGPMTEELMVARWADIPVGSTITGDVTLHTVPGFLSGRRVWVYLPPNYHDEPSRHFPVLYMFDGQNVFDEATSFAGEWHVDETCEQLIPAGEVEPILVVAVANGELGRIDEYTPWPDPTYGGGGGEAHLQEFLTVLLPWVEANYRVLTGPHATGISGSSLGGLMSLYAAYAHSGSFGRIGALSPSLWWSDEEMIGWASTLAKPDVRAYMDMGTRESGAMVDEDNNGIDDSIDDLRAMRDVMLSQGFVLDEDLKVVEDEGAQHNEFYWAARFPDVLRYLFPPNTVDVVEWIAAGASDLSMAPNPFRGETTLRLETRARSVVSVTIYDVSGRRIRALADGPRVAGFHELLWNGRDDSGARVGSGIYFVRLDSGQEEVTRKLILLRD